MPDDQKPSDLPPSALERITRLEAELEKARRAQDPELVGLLKKRIDELEAQVKKPKEQEADTVRRDRWGWPIR